ncbi:MAG: glycoside hydrolase, partial [Verrucomicrobia bacterium]|nr:glycoside hydrolase [Verrucomicrobiota bacterium]
GEFLEYGGNSDEVSGEFWATGNLGDIELRDASSAAHIYGKPSVFAESFTGGPLFTSTPWSLKERGDWAFCQGINRTVLHVYIEQPWDQRRPGVSAWFGTEFNRNNTWFSQARPWIDYLRRCSFLLQQGRHVADVAYYIGEDCPKMTGECKPALPPGYDFDYINADVIERRLTVQNGRFVLPDGTSYRLLELPDEKTMRPAVLRKLRDLILAGGTVLGPEPVRSPSLEDYPACDAEIRQMAAALWGQGRVTQDTNLETVLDRLHTPPDLAGVNPTNILFTHRRTATADIYFLSNQSDAPADIAPIFRVRGRAPELWRPGSGLVERLAIYAMTSHGERVPIHLAPRGSVFVVFRQAAEADPIVSVSRNNRTLINVANPPATTNPPPAVEAPGATPVSLTRTARGSVRALVWQPGEYQITTADGRTRTLDAQSVPSPLKIAGPWMVSFPPGNGIAKHVRFDRLESWTERPEPAIKYFSGTAAYRKRFEIPADRFGKTRRLYLDIGRVKDLVEVILNGKNLGTLWMEPFRLDVTQAARPGWNDLELRVVN